MYVLYVRVTYINYPQRPDNDHSFQMSIKEDKIFNLLPELKSSLYQSTATQNTNNTEAQNQDEFMDDFDGDIDDLLEMMDEPAGSAPVSNYVPSSSKEEKYVTDRHARRRTNWGDEFEDDFDVTEPSVGIDIAKTAAVSSFEDELHFHDQNIAGSEQDLSREELNLNEEEFAENSFFEKDQF